MDTHELDRMLIQQGQRALARTSFLIDRLWKIFPVPAPGIMGAVMIAQEAPELLQDLAASFGLASTLLFDDSPKRSRETARVYELRLHRTQSIRSLCHDIDFSALTNKRIRDRMVHIDEHLTKAYISNPSAYWLMDLAFATREQFRTANPGVVAMYCRVYIASERRILHLDEELDTFSLRGACEATLQRLMGNLNLG